MQIFEHNSEESKKGKRRNAVAFQAFLTKLSAEFAEKMLAVSYENKFLFVKQPCSNSKI